MPKPKRHKPEIQRLAKNLVRIMEKHNIDGTHLAELLTIQGNGEYTCSQSLMSHMRRGKFEFSKWIPRLSKAIGCDIMEFYA